MSRAHKLNQIGALYSVFDTFEYLTPRRKNFPLSWQPASLPSAAPASWYVVGILKAGRYGTVPFSFIAASVVAQRPYTVKSNKEGCGERNPFPLSFRWSVGTENRIGFKGSPGVSELEPLSEVDAHPRLGLVGSSSFLIMIIATLLGQ